MGRADRSGQAARRACDGARRDDGRNAAGGDEGGVCHEVGAPHETGATCRDQPGQRRWPKSGRRRRPARPRAGRCQTPSGRLLRPSALPEDRPTIFTAQFALSHGCWLISYPLARWLGAWVGTGPSFAVLALIAAVSMALALWVSPAAAEAQVAHRHDDMPPAHPHLRDWYCGQGRAHPVMVDDLHRHWPKSA